MSDSNKELGADLTLVSEYLCEIASFNRRGELAAALSDPERRRAYELSDGRRTSQEIADDAAIGKSAASVRRWWTEWREQGLIDDRFSELPRRRYVTYFLASDSE